MQVTNGNTTVQLDEQKILNMILDQRLVLLENVVKQHYECRSVTDLSKSQFYEFMYLCIVALDVKAAELSEAYNVSINSIVEGTTKVFEKGHTNKVYYGKLYSLYITYKQVLRTKNAALNVA